LVEWGRDHRGQKQTYRWGGGILALGCDHPCLWDGKTDPREEVITRRTDVARFVGSENHFGTDAPWVLDKVVDLVLDFPSGRESGSTWVGRVEDDHGGIGEGRVVVELRP
jgi:hypothetical protein